MDDRKLSFAETDGTFVVRFSIGGGFSKFIGERIFDCFRAFADASVEKGALIEVSPLDGGVKAKDGALGGAVGVEFNLIDCVVAGNNEKGDFDVVVIDVSGNFKTEAGVSGLGLGAVCAAELRGN